MQPLDDGRVLVGTAKALEVVDVEGGAPPRVVLDQGARNIVPDQTGSRLLVTTCGNIPYFILDAESLKPRSSITGEYGGAVAWWGEASGQLLLVSEAVDFGGQMEQRIHTLLETIPEIGGTPTPVGWPIDVFARAGTIAPQGIFWGLPARSWQVDPLPGVLVVLEGTSVRGRLVEPSPWADIQPAGGRDGRLYWIRTREHGSNSGRLMTQGAGTGTNIPRVITSDPTWLLGTSASGDTIAWFGGGDGPTELWIASREELAEVDSQAAAAADESLATKWRAANQRLTIAFADCTVADDLITSGPMPYLAANATWEDVDLLGRAFEQALESDFGLPDDDRGWVEKADMILSDSAGFIGHGPIETLAIGGFMVRECRRRGIGTNMAVAGGPTLAIKEKDWAWTDERTMVLASPWGIARACIDRELTPGVAIAELTAQGSLPVIWVDGFDAPVQRQARGFLLGIAGLPADEESTPAFSRALELFPDCDVCAEELARRGVNDGLPQRALEGAAHLASRRPLSPDAFALLAEALVANAHREEGRRAMDWALVLSPLDPGLRLQSASLAFVLGDLDRSKREFGEVLLLPGGAVFQEIVNSRLRLISESSAKEATP